MKNRKRGAYASALIFMAALCACGDKKSEPVSELPAPTVAGASDTPVEFVANPVSGIRLNEYQVHLQWPKEIHDAFHFIERIGNNNKKHFELATNPQPSTVDPYTSTLAKYEYQLFERVGSENKLIATQTVVIPVDVIADEETSLQNISGMKQIGSLYLWKKHYRLNGHPIFLNARKLFTLEEGVEIETFDATQEAENRDGRSGGQVSIQAGEALGPLTIHARGESAGSKFYGRNGGDSPRVLVQLARQSKFKFEIIATPGKGADGGKDGDKNPYCVRNGAVEEGRCISF